MIFIEISFFYIHSVKLSKGSVKVSEIHLGLQRMSDPRDRIAAQEHHDRIATGSRQDRDSPRSHHDRIATGSRQDRDTVSHRIATNLTRSRSFTKDRNKSTRISENNDFQWKIDENSDYLLNSLNFNENHKNKFFL